MEFKFTVKKSDPVTGEIVTIGTKTMYPAEGQINNWAEESLPSSPMAGSLRLSSAVKPRTEMEPRGLRCDGFGMMLSKGNNVYENGIKVALFTSAYSDSGSRCVQIAPDNFDRVTALFLARRSIKRDWINWQDEYFTPNMNHPDYRQWNNDAIVYSLFNTKSNQSSLRGIDYMDKVWNPRNQFFFISNQEMKELANQVNFVPLLRDSESFGGDTYAYKQLQGLPLSPDAQEVLEAARQLVRDSMKFRLQWYDNPPEDVPDLHLQAWDAGWAQLKPIFKKHFEVEYNAFRELYKQFEDRLRPGVYKFGFLKGEFVPTPEPELAMA